jgi:hypothetical protein
VFVTAVPLGVCERVFESGSRSVIVVVLQSRVFVFPPHSNPTPQCD